MYIIRQPFEGTHGSYSRVRVQGFRISEGFLKESHTSFSGLTCGVGQGLGTIGCRMPGGRSPDHCDWEELAQLTLTAELSLDVLLPVLTL